MKHAKRVAGIVLVALLALVAVEAQAAGEPYELYAMTSLTGPAAFLGRGEASTFAVAEKYINATGGIKGQPLHIIVQDDGSNPATAVSLASQVFAKHVAATVGPGFGATCTALLPLVADGPVMYCLSNVIHPASGTFAFSYAPAGTEESGPPPCAFSKPGACAKLGCWRRPTHPAKTRRTRSRRT